MFDVRNIKKYWKIEIRLELSSYICGVKATTKSRQRIQNGCYEDVRPTCDEVAR